MKKLYSISLIATLLVSSSAVYANAAPRGGSICAKKGLVSISAGKKFTCIASGKKLVWDGGVAISSTKSNSPAAPSSFKDLFELRRGIAYGAWSKVSNTLTTDGIKIPDISVYQGPHTSVYVSDIRKPFQFVTRLFPTVDLPKKYVVLYWNNSDMGWATAKATELMGAVQLQKFVDENGGPFVDCYTPTDCNVGHAFIASDGTAYIGLGNPDNAQGDPNYPLGQKEAVEFYHALQLFQYFKNNSPITTKNNIPSPNFPPAWINVAGENFTFDALRFEKNYQGFESAQNFSDWMNHIGHPITQAWLDDFLNIKNLGNTWSENGFISIRDNNCIGASIIEIFVALKGPSVLLDFHVAMSQGKSFQEVFKNEFGTTWEEASPIISKIIFDKYQNRY